MIKLRAMWDFVSRVLTVRVIRFTGIVIVIGMAIVVMASMEQPSVRFGEAFVLIAPVILIARAIYIEIVERRKAIRNMEMS